MSNSVFLDTNGWIQLLNASERNHVHANRVWLDLGQRGYRIVLTDWIIAEPGNGLARSTAKANFAIAIEQLWRSSAVEVVTVDQSLIARAIIRYRQFADKTWGLVDCASFIVMEDRGITEAFTSDRDFEQAGFVRLLVG
jgi:predicted nucleic acid-binding protein